MARIWFVFWFLAISATVALGADGVAAQPTVAVGDAPLWKGILNGFVAGIVSVFYGYAKNRNPKTGEMEGFDVKYAFPTLVVGGLIGVIATFVHLTPQDLASSLTTSPIYGAVVFAAEALLKALFRHSVPWIRDAIDKLKGAPKPPPPPVEPAPAATGDRE